jgi:hypothetical protein
MATLSTGADGTRQGLIGAFIRGERETFEKVLSTCQTPPVEQSHADEIFMDLLTSMTHDGSIGARRQMISSYLKHYPSCVDAVTIEEAPKSGKVRSAVNVLAKAIYTEDMQTVRIVQAAGAKPCNSEGPVEINGIRIGQMLTVFVLLDPLVPHEMVKQLAPEVLKDWKTHLTEAAQKALADALALKCAEYLSSPNPLSTFHWRKVQFFLQAGFNLLGGITVGKNFFELELIVKKLKHEDYQREALQIVEAAVKAGCAVPATLVHDMLVASRSEDAVLYGLLGAQEGPFTSLTLHQCFTGNICYRHGCERPV